MDYWWWSTDPGRRDRLGTNKRKNWLRKNIQSMNILSFRPSHIRSTGSGGDPYGICLLVTHKPWHPATPFGSRAIPYLGGYQINHYGDSIEDRCLPLKFWSGIFDPFSFSLYPFPILCFSCFALHWIPFRPGPLKLHNQGVVSLSKERVFSFFPYDCVHGQNESHS